MPETSSYEAAVEAAKQALEAAKSAGRRTVVANAEWTFLRHRFDAWALVEHITEAAAKGDFVGKLHAAADKARQQQQARGPPPKENKEAAPNPKLPKGGASARAPASI